jgi:hypothetical protein
MFPCSPAVASRAFEEPATSFRVPFKSKPKDRKPMVREGPAEPAPPKQEPYPAEKARGGVIVLNTPARRWIFLAGLAGAVVLVLVLGFLR